MNLGELTGFLVDDQDMLGPLIQYTRDKPHEQKVAGTNHPMPCSAAPPKPEPITESPERFFRDSYAGNPISVWVADYGTHEEAAEALAWERANPITCPSNDIGSTVRKRVAVSGLLSPYEEAWNGTRWLYAAEQIGTVVAFTGARLDDSYDEAKTRADTAHLTVAQRTKMGEAF